jgi:17beta-estradiol 17-dehydrogenase / very-long-chain 3-oxoacyl-CoA reductase
MASTLDLIKAHLPLVVTGAFVAKLSLQFLTSFYVYFLRPAKKVKKLGEWAVVTGATDGIGKGYAMQLAQAGMNVLLISRTEAKLKAVKEEIDAKTNKSVEVKIAVCDYSNFDDTAQKSIAESLRGLDVGVLINNVGVSYRYPQFFHEITDAEVTQLIEMNVNSTTWMTRLVLDGMVERKRGSIVNISSGSAMYAMPLLAEYSAAKSFIEKFSLALNAEYASYGITVQCQIPFYVATKLAKMRKSFTVPTSDQFAKMGMRFIGQAEAVASPYWVHAIMGFVLDHVPGPIAKKVVYSMHMAIRKKGKKKDEAKTK